MVEKFAVTPFLYFVVVPEAPLKDGVFLNSSYHVPKALFLSLSKVALSPRITCYRELGGLGNLEVNNGRRLGLGSV